MERGILRLAATGTFAWALWKALDALVDYVKDNSSQAAETRKDAEAVSAVAALATLTDPASPLSQAVAALQESSRGSLVGLSESVGEQMRLLSRDEQRALALMLAGAVVQAQAEAQA